MIKSKTIENDIPYRLNCEKIKLILLIWDQKTARVGIESVVVNSQKKYLEVYHEVGKEFDWKNGNAGFYLLWTLLILWFFLILNIYYTNKNRKCIY